MLEALPEALCFAGKTPTCVVAVGDRDSRILAAALATRFHLGRRTELTDAPIPPGGLVVAYEWSRADQNELLRHVPDLVTFFGYSVDWTLRRADGSRRGLPARPADPPAVGTPDAGDRKSGTPESRPVTIPADVRDVGEIAAGAAAWAPEGDAGQPGKGEDSALRAARRESENADGAALLEATIRAGAAWDY